MNENKIKKIEYIKESFKFKQLKEYHKAVEMLYKALAIESKETNDEDNVEILSQIGFLFMELENYPKALEEFQKALTINPNHSFSVLKSFDIYFKEKQFSKALNLAQKYCENNKNSIAYLNYFKALVALNKTQDAIEIFNALDENIKLDPDILYTISKIDPKKRKLLLEKIVDIDETHVDANLELAEIELREGNYNKVINYCLNIVDDNPLALYYLALVEQSRHEYSKAIDLFIRAINIDYDTHDFYFDLAKAYCDIAWFEEALFMLKKSVNFSIAKNEKEKLDEKYFLIGWILIKQNQSSKALLNLNLINKNSSFYLRAQILIQSINLKNKNLATAKKALEQNYEKEKDNPLFLEVLAGVYKELKLYKQSIETYKKALIYYPDSIFYALEIIDLLIDNEEYDEAIKRINDFCSKYKNCANIYNSLARIYYRLKDLSKALESINRYIELDCNNSEAYYFKGLILNDMSDYEKAAESIYEAIKFKPDAAKYYAQMARSYLGFNQPNDALLYIKEAIELNQNEINYVAMAFEIAQKIGNKHLVELYQKQLERSKALREVSR